MSNRFDWFNIAVRDYVKICKQMQPIWKGQLRGNSKLEEKYRVCLYKLRLYLDSVGKRFRVYRL